VFGHVATGHDKGVPGKRRPGDVNAAGSSAATLAMAETGIFRRSCDLEFHIAAKAMSGVRHLNEGIRRYAFFSSLLDLIR